MNNKTLLAGKTFSLSERQSQKIEDIYNLEDAPAYIKFEAVLVGDFKTFSLYNQDNVLLLNTEITETEFVKNNFKEFCTSDNAVEDFYKLKSKKKGKTQMLKVSTMLKMILDKDTKAMVEMGYLNSELTLTEEGTDWLLAQLYGLNKAELGKVAQAELTEKKSKSKKYSE
jgi:hypothetical protein